MSIFGQIIRTAVNTALLPVAVVKDVVTLGRAGEPESFTERAIRELKDEAEDE